MKSHNRSPFYNTMWLVIVQTIKKCIQKFAHSETSNIAHTHNWRNQTMKTDKMERRNKYALHTNTYAHFWKVWFSSFPSFSSLETLVLTFSFEGIMKLMTENSQGNWLFECHQFHHSRTNWTLTCLVTPTGWVIRWMIIHQHSTFEEAAMQATR